MGQIKEFIGDLLLIGITILVMGEFNIVEVHPMKDWGLPHTEEFTIIDYQDTTETYTDQVEYLENKYKNDEQ